MFAKTPSIKIISVYNLIEIIEVIRFILKREYLNCGLLYLNANWSGDTSIKIHVWVHCYNIKRGIARTIPLIINKAKQGVNHV